MTTRPRVAVIGGGITGLAAAHEASRAGCPVVVFEAGRRPGGKLSSETFHDVVVEAGADSFILDQTTGGLCEEVGLGDQLVAPEVFGAYVLRGDRLVRMPLGSPYGVPSSLRAAYGARLLTPWGVARAALDLVLPRRPFRRDVSIGDFVRARLGREVVDRMVDPMLAGTRAGSAWHVSLEAGAPQIYALASKHHSLLRALRTHDVEPPGFATVRGGLSRLVERISRADSIEVRLGARVHEIEPGYHVRVGAWSDRFDCVVVTVPAFQAARMVRGLSPDASAGLERIRYASSAVVTLAYPTGSVTPPPDGSGFLVPSNERLTLAACTWYSHKWSHARPPDGAELVRCFVARGLDAFPRGNEEALVERVRLELRRIMGTPVESLSASVRRWERSLPVYEVGHARRIGDITTALADHRGVALAGAAYYGAGISDCIRQGRAAARDVISALP